MDYKAVLGLLAIVVGFIGYVPYLRDIFGNKTKPHAFSWLVWGVLTAVAFGGQIAGKAGAGAWVTGVTALVCLMIFILSLSKGVKDFPLADWLCLLGAVFSLGLWALTKNPLTAIVLITVIDMLAFIPTFRKSYTEPYSETSFTYMMSGLKFLIGLFALQNYSWVTGLYPVSLVITNAAFVSMLNTRRRRITLADS